MKNELIVFARAPRSGQVKTRLAAVLGKEAACEAYRVLLQALSREISGIADGIVQYSPADGEDELRPFFPPQWRFRPQKGVDLGERLLSAFAESFACGASRVLIIGSDCPYIAQADIASGWDALERADLVIGPALDGGYWMIGLRSETAAAADYSELFAGISWGTSRVLEQTMAGAQRLGLKTAHLRTLSDVDQAEDWSAFVRTLIPPLPRQGQ